MSKLTFSQACRASVAVVMTLTVYAVSVATWATVGAFAGVAIVAVQTSEHDNPVAVAEKAQAWQMVGLWKGAEQCAVNCPWPQDPAPCLTGPGSHVGEDEAFFRMEAWRVAAKSIDLR